MHKTSRIFVAGHQGLAGSAIVRNLNESGHECLITRTRAELDLLDQKAVHEFFRAERIEYAFIAAARVGGIYANATEQADFLYENLVIATNAIHAAAEHGVTKLLFLGSSCIYPRDAVQPIREHALLTGPLGETNEGYAIAKIAGLKLCQMYRRQYGKRFISAMPTNLYGPGDNFHPTRSHVIPGMMRRFHEAKESGAASVTIWGTGKPLREFLHVDDLAAGLQVLIHNYEEEQTINVGSGEECTILDLAQQIAEVTEFGGKIVLDPDKPDGTPRKLLDSSRIRALGWAPRYDLRTGLRDTYRWALENEAFARASTPLSEAPPD